MSDKKISDLVELTTLAADDVLPVVDASANATKRITGANLSNFPTQPTFNGNDVYHQGNVVGTVSQSGGTPTGAVVELVNDSLTFTHWMGDLRGLTTTKVNFELYGTETLLPSDLTVLCVAVGRWY